MTILRNFVLLFFPSLVERYLKSFTDAGRAYGQCASGFCTHVQPEGKEYQNKGIGLPFQRMTGPTSLVILSILLFAPEITIGQSAQETEASNVPWVIMFQPPLDHNKEAGGFYVGKLSNGSVFNLNLYYADGSGTKSREIKEGSFWYPRYFDGRVATIEVLVPKNPDTFILGVRQSGSDGKPTVVGDVSAFGFANGHGQFLAAAKDSTQHMDETLTGKMSKDWQNAEGTWVDNVHHKQSQFTMERVFIYEAITKPWPFAESPDYPNDIVGYAKFSTIFPDLPYPDAQAGVLKDASHCDADGECENEVSVVGFSDGVLTLRTWQLDHTIGTSVEYGAGYSIFDVSEKPVKKILLDQVIKQSGDCAARIQTLVADRLTILLDEVHAGAAMTPTLKQGAGKSPTSFIVSRASVTFQYQPTDINTAFSAGEFFVTLSKSELGRCFNMVK